MLIYFFWDGYGIIRVGSVGNVKVCHGAVKGAINLIRGWLMRLRNTTSSFRSWCCRLRCWRSNWRCSYPQFWSATRWTPLTASWPSARRWRPTRRRADPPAASNIFLSFMEWNGGREGGRGGSGFGWAWWCLVRIANYFKEFLGDCFDDGHHKRRGGRVRDPHGQERCGQHNSQHQPSADPVGGGGMGNHKHKRIMIKLQ